jgi:hypothetical protein
VKFKNDGCGWRDLRFERGDKESIQVSIDKSTRDDLHDNSPFVSISEGGAYAAFHMSITELRKFAKAILKETDK